VLTHGSVLYREGLWSTRNVSCVAAADACAVSLVEAHS
jgi:hypothetical protein